MTDVTSFVSEGGKILSRNYADICRPGKISTHKGCDSFTFCFTNINARSSIR